MAITWICGFESGDLLAEPSYLPSSGTDTPSISGDATLETTIVRSGGGSLKLLPPSGGGARLALSDAVSTDVIYVRIYLRITSLPGTAREIFGNATSGRLRIHINPSGTLEFLDNTTTLFTSSTALTDTSKWYKVVWKCGSSGSELWIDGVSQGSDATSLGYLFRFGTTALISATYTAYIDDCAVDNAAEPGGGSVLLAVPVSVNQGGSWTGGAGGAVETSAVDFPPAGTASETDSTQIESVDTSGNNSTDECRINLTTYTNLGIGASDTINAIMPFVKHGEDISTGTKTGSMGMQNNPSDTYSTFDYGNSTGALGTFNVKWHTSYIVTSSPSVTLGNNPVIAVRKTDAGTRVASVCAMGMYVDYTPAAVALFKQIGYQVKQAVKRASVY